MRVVSGSQGWAGIRKGDLVIQHSTAFLGSSEVGPLEWCWHTVLGWCSLSSDIGWVQDEFRALANVSPDLRLHVWLVRQFSSICIATTDKDSTGGDRCPACYVSLAIGKSLQPPNSLHVSCQKVPCACHVYLLWGVLRPIITSRIFLDLCIFSRMIGVVMVLS